MSCRLSQIYLYPVKSLAGIEVRRWPLDRFGLKFDRRWMVVRPDGRFLTQRQCPQMATIRTAIDLESGRLTLFHPERGERVVPEPEGRSITVQVWRDRVEAIQVSREVDLWLEEVLGQPCHLVWFPELSKRIVDPKYSPFEAETAFSDGFPLLIIGEDSLADLNRNVEQPVEMRRFRPNLVIAGTEAYAEDRWKKIEIGKIPILIVKPCTRCVVTTIDPDRGVRTGEEPLRTISKLRQGCFGQNAIHAREGWLEVDMEVKVVE